MKKRLKALYLASKFDDTTGGLKYNTNFILQLKLSERLNIDIKTDADFGVQGNMNYKQAKKLYKNQLADFAGYDYFIVDSRKYTHLYWMLPKLKKVNQNLKIIMFHHHYDYMCNIGIKKVIKKFLELNFLKNADYIIHASEFTYEITKKIIKNNCKLELIKVPIESNNNCVHCNSLSSNISSIGDSPQRKGQFELIKAFVKVYKLNPRLHLNMIGNITESNKIKFKKYLQKNKCEDNVSFLGRVSEEEFNNVLADSFVFAFPSLFEGYGLALYESMQYSLPAVVFNNSAMPYAVKNGVNGFIVKNKDTNAFANAIIELDNNREFAKNMGDNAYEVFKNRTTKNDYNLEIEKFKTELGV